MLDYLLLIIFPGAMAFAAAMDLITMTIPNRVSIVLVAAFFVLAPLAGLGLQDMSLHIAAGCVTLVVGFVFFSRGWMGGGDAKLCAAAALWLGFEHLITFALVSALLGGALTLALLFLRKFPLPLSLVGQTWIVRLHNVQEGIPYGIALGAAGLIVYPSTAWMPPLIH
ncbi:MAG: A24 family peptidase [Methyloligellaceae bacterium]